MTAIDRLEFHLRLKTADGMKGTRINFLREVQNWHEARKVPLPALNYRWPMRVC
jgi:hypothetical protein